jgi:hypothetical protein
MVGSRIRSGRFPSFVHVSWAAVAGGAWLSLVQDPVEEDEWVVVGVMIDDRADRWRWLEGY